MAEYIEREAVLGCFHDWVDRYGDVHSADEMPEFGRIEALPAADVVERKRGAWIKNEFNAGWRCSVCKTNNYYAYSWDSEKGENEFQDNFCPHCGADMREPPKEATK